MMKIFRMYTIVTILFFAAAFLLFACSQVVTTEGEPPSVVISDTEKIRSTESGEQQISEPEDSASVIKPAADLPGALLQPDDLIYAGAFRLPDEPSEYGWSYSGYAMTFYPDGDKDGQQDGYPGSLFILGHDQTQQVAQVNIPAPVISSSKNTTDLPTAAYLLEFHDITNGMFGELEIPRAGLEYLPPQGAQTTGKLYFCWGQHFQFEREASHGWSELDLTAPNPAGPWHVGEYSNYVTNDYLFEIPESWSNAFTPGLRLVTGRFRDGSWGGLGPTLFAIAPWNEGNPPPSGTTLEQVIPLLLYGENVPGIPEISVSENRRMVTYSEPDEWSGGAWLTASETTVGDKSAVVLVGTKAVGRSWYGFSNGVEYPISGDTAEEYPEVPPWPHDDRGWWSEDISAQIIFFNPIDFGAVVHGEMETWQPQPYASLTLDGYLFDPGFNYERQKRYLLGAAAFDRENGLLYIIERMADDDERSLIHIFRLESK
ncbi:MAG: hypothetical protein U9R58_00625 [Chloroflexota bacterium]|nr:hypothetical protein [Chloroflexota bacterium]